MKVTRASWDVFVSRETLKPELGSTEVREKTYASEEKRRRSGGVRGVES